MNDSAARGQILEILTLDIQPGRRDEFHRLYLTKALPLLRKWHFRVVAHGPSLHDENSYYVIRLFNSLAERESSEDAYYSSEDWKNGPRSAILDLVEHFAYAVVSAATWQEVSGVVQSPTDP